MSDQLQEYINWCCDKYLSYRPRTEREMRMYLQRKLIKKGIRSKDEQAPIIEKKVQELLESGALDDKAFARWFVGEKQYFKKWGKIRIKQELMQKGISSAHAEQVLAESESEDKDLLQQLFDSKFATTDFSEEATKQKVIQHLQRRGYTYSDISSAIEEFAQKE